MVEEKEKNWKKKTATNIYDFNPHLLQIYTRQNREKKRIQ